MVSYLQISVFFNVSGKKTRQHHCGPKQTLNIFIRFILVYYPIFLETSRALGGRGRETEGGGACNVVRVDSRRNSIVQNNNNNNYSFCF